MTEWFWKKLSYFSGLAAIVVLFALIGLWANIEIKDLDLWLHLAMGRYITHNSLIPHTDVLSCTIAGKEWINHEWLFQVIVYFIYQRAGFDGLIALQVAIVILTTLLLLSLGYDKRRQLVSIVLLFLVVMVYQLRFTLRPDLFSLLFFTLYVYILGSRLNSKMALGALFLIQVLWTNIHGFFILGPFLVLLMLIAEYLKRHLRLPFDWNATGRLSGDDLSQLTKILVIVSLACFINPYFVKGVTYPLGVLASVSGESKIFFQDIVELQRPLTWDTLFSLKQYLHYKLLIIISFLSFFANYRKINISTLLFWLIFLLFSLSALRNIPFFAFAAYFVTLTNIYDFTLPENFPLRFKGERIQSISATVLKIMMIVFVCRTFHQLSLRGYFDFSTYERKSEIGGVSLRNYPYKAVDFLSENKIKGRFFNDFNSGAYLLGRLHPDVKVFIDGRTEVYGAKFFMQYREAMHGDAKLLDKLINQYKLTGAFLGCVYVPVPKDLISYFYNNHDWALVYFDYDAAIFLRDIPQNQAWIKKHRINLMHWNPPVTDLLKLGVRPVTPYQNLNRAEALFNLNFLDKALNEANTAINIEPSFVDAYKLVGKIYLEKKQYNEAFENLRKAKVLNPDDMETRYDLAESLFYLDHVAQAYAQCDRVLKASPKNAKALFLLARIYAKERKYPEVLSVLKSVEGIKSSEINQIMDIGEILIEQKSYRWAQQVYNFALQNDPGNAVIKETLKIIQSAIDHE